MSAHAIATLARHEFRMRIRTGRWKWLLGVWLVTVTGLTGLLWAAVSSTVTSDPRNDRGALLFDALMLFALGVGVLVTPALAAQSVNGDRERGVLATLQVSLLTPAELALGKLAAAWGTALVFLGLTLPAVVLCAVAGGIQPLRVVVTFATLGLLLGVFCALALALSAWLRRTVTSSLVSYLLVTGMCLGTVVAFAFATALDTHRVHYTYTVPASALCTPPPLTTDSGGCAVQQDQTIQGEEVHSRTDRSWVWLAPNPFVVLADAAPQTRRQREGGSFDVLGGLGRSVRRLRLPDRSGPQRAAEYDEGRPEPDGGAVWPWGLAFDVGLGVAAVAMATRRLRTPARTLPRGARVA